MTLRLTPPPRPDSLLAQLDPRWRLAALVPAAFAAAVLRTVPAAAAALAGALLLAALARLPPRWLLTRLGALGLFLLLFAAPLPLLLEGEGWDWGPVHLSEHGLAAGALLCLKAVTVVTLALVALAASPLDETLKAAHSLRVPGLLVQLALLTYRYVFLLGEELRRLRVALRVRGFRNRATRHSWRTLGHVAGTLLVRGHERAERVGQAMRCRGFDGRFRSLTAFRTTLADVAFFLAILGGTGVLCAWDYCAAARG
jgi:cobalt/nickel transport system permease protein